MQYHLLRKANVRVEKDMVPIESKDRHVERPAATIIVNDKFVHNFPVESRVSKALELIPEKELEQRLNGGHYFFVDDTLVDFRDGMYDGFVHTDKSIAKLNQVLGICTAEEFGKGIRSVKGNTLTGELILGRAWSNCPITVPGYAKGNDYNSQLIFIWNPFVQTINTFFQLVRLICTNGMVGLTNFLNTRIPLINRWEEHLEIANRQIQNKVDAIAIQRFSRMMSERASIAEVTQVANHAHKRLAFYSKHNASGVDSDMASRIATIADPAVHLSEVYRPEVLEDKRLAAQLPSHLTTYDAYNLATELRSHTTEVPLSTDFALDRFSNQILFDRNNLVTSARSINTPTLSSFSDPERAFFGKAH